MDIKALVEHLRAAIEAQLPMPVPCVVGHLPPSSGVSLVVAGGTVERYMRGDVLVKQLIYVNAKSKDQREALEMIQRAAAVVQSPPQADAFVITGVSVKKLPEQIGLDASMNYLYGATFEVRAYFSEG